MSSKLIIHLTVLIQFILISCSSAVVIHDGKTPEQVASELASLAGTYKGSVRLKTREGMIDQPLLSDASLTIILGKDRSIELVAAPDWLGENCGMKIGKLIELKDFNEKDPTNYEASFELDPGKCQEKTISNTVRLVVTKDTNGKILLQTFLAKELFNSRHLGRRPINYFGNFSKID